ncbi:hypothetical protein [Renibacterium salmoninarum]|uniref:hypothetical protein n=1 Tax=Renibacterium salmoninarum TaxID=1646 RepID=UPI0011AB53E8|nr:hypothetical protein [Renibacterium salmoninarum]
MIKTTRYRRRSHLVIATASAVCLTAAAVPVAQAANQIATDEGPGYTVEPFGIPLEAGYTVENGVHPGAEMIAAKTKILLKEGDGNIMYAECTGAKDQIRIDGSTFEHVCFQPTGPAGWLKMEIPDSFGVATRTYDLSVTSTDQGKTDTKDLYAKDGGGPIFNRSTDSNVTVVEIRIKGTS